MDSLAYIAPWVLGSVCVGLAMGFFVGRGRSQDVQEKRLVQLERKTTLKVLLALLKSAKEMTTDVECHNSEIQQTADHVGNLRVTGEMENVKRAFLGQIAGLLSSNTRLQDTLTCTRYRMEEQAQEIDRARREARTDPLTGVSNRKALDEKLHLLQSDWDRKGLPFVLILLDLDYFKRINDAHGHQAGDYVLQKVGAWLKDWVRKEDFVGRYGGDEFAILLPCTELDVGLKLAETIRLRTAEETSRIALRREQVSVSISLGVAAPRQGDTPASVLRRADRALYKSKDLGRNQVNLQEPAPEEPVGQAAVAASES